MKLSVDHSFAFLCNPKCGSTSVEKAITPFCRTSLAGHSTLKHINAKTYHRHIRPILRKAGLEKQIETFCIMREPVERVFSWYRYQARPALKDTGHQGHAKYTGNVSFEEFVRAYLSEDENRPEFAARIGTQADFITLKNGNLGIDRIFRLENMAAVEEYLSRKVGKPVRIPYRNVTPDKSKKSGKKEKAGFLASLFASRPSEVASPAPVLEKPKMEISPELLARLTEHLAEDYRIYNGHTVK